MRESNSPLELERLPSFPLDEWAVAGELGFEPRYEASKTPVLPLDDSPLGAAALRPADHPRVPLLPGTRGYAENTQPTS